MFFGYSLTSDDPAVGSLTFSNLRELLDHRMRQKAPYFVSLLSSSARSYLDTSQQRMLRPVSEVADIETRLGLAGRHVDPVFQHSRRHYVGFVRDLVEAASVGFVEGAVEHVGCFFVAKWLVLRGSLLMRVPAPDIL